MKRETRISRSERRASRLKKPPGNLAGRRGLLDVVDGEREEVDALARLARGDGDQHDGLAVA